MLGSVQNYHGGLLAGAQLSWQLTLEPGTSGTVWTGQPAGGGDILPRVGQTENTLVAIYNPRMINIVLFNVTTTTAHFNRDGYQVNRLKQPCVDFEISHGRKCWNKITG